MPLSPFMRWNTNWGFLPIESASSLDVETARASLALRAAQSIHAKFAVWAVCVVTVLSLLDELSLGILLAWSLPVMLMAEINWRISRRTVLDLPSQNAKGLRQRQMWMWWSTLMNQSIMGTTVWWFGSTHNFGLAALGTALMLVYLGGAMINAATHPITFVPGAWINLLSACAYWLTGGIDNLPMVGAMLGAGLMATRLSQQMADSFRESLRMRFENDALLKQLEKEKQLAEEATQIKSDFLANISHEVRTPVSAIMGMSYLALKSDLTERQRDYLEVIQQCSQHLHGLINQVLDFSKIEASMLKLERNEFSLRTVLDSVQAINADKASAKGLTLTVRVHQGVPGRLVGDSLRVTEILVNFISNAIKFTELGKIQLDIESKDQRPHQVKLMFAVTDTGMGLSPEEIGRLFKSFSQADHSAARQHGGTGLGLAISKRLAELMDGEVGVQSEPGNGSTFWFSAWFDLPRSPDELADGLADATQAPPGLAGWTHSTLPCTSGPTSIDLMASQASDPADGSAAAAVCRRLAALVDTDNPEAVDLLEAHAIELRQRLGAAFGALERHVRRYELPQAARLLASLGYTGEHHGPRSSSPSGEATKQSILVVDDTAVNLAILVDLLRPVHRVRVATTGARALAIAQDDAPPDLILLDVMMPGMDGYEVLSRLKEQASTADIPVVFLTARSQLEDEERGLKLGAADFISKPFSPPLLRQRLRTLLDLSATRKLLAGQGR